MVGVGGRARVAIAARFGRRLNVRDRERVKVRVRAKFRLGIRI